MNYQCICCLNYSLKFYHSLRDSKEKNIFICENCNLIQLHPRLEKIINLVEGGEQEKQDKFRNTSDLDLKNNNYDRVGNLLNIDSNRYLNHLINCNLDLLDEKINILDIGCGYGTWCNLINNKSKYKVYGLDLNLNKIRYGQNKYKYKFSYFIDKIENSDFINKNKEKFDIITCWHVLEHVYDPVLFLNNINILLKKNGILLMEVPNEDDELIKLVPEYSKLIHFEDHVNYFTKNTINNLFDKCNLNKKNLEIQGIQRYGFYNYIDWLRFGNKNKVLSDDYRDTNNYRNNIEKIWLNYRIENFNCDTLLIKYTKN